MSENDVVKACLEYLRWKRIPAWRINNTGVWDPVRKIYRKSPNITAGVSDIIAIVPPTGKMLAIECKTKTGKVSQSQRLFLEDVLRAGGEAIVARCVDDLTRALEAMGVRSGKL